MFVHRSWNVDSQRYSPEREVRITYTLWSAVFCFLQSLLILDLEHEFSTARSGDPCIQLHSVAFFSRFQCDLDLLFPAVDDPLRRARLQSLPDRQAMKLSGPWRQRRFVDSCVWL